MVRITATIATAIIIAAIYFKLFLFRPKANIYHLVFRFNKPKRSIAITGDPHAKAHSLEFVLYPIDQVKPFPFRFKKLVTDEEAEEKGFKTVFNIPGDKSRIVEREELVPGYRGREFHPIVVEFLSKDKVDMFIVLLIAYRPIDPVLMYMKTKNWLEYAETEIVDLIGTWGRNTDAKDIFETNIDTLRCDAAKSGMTVEEQLNKEKFNSDIPEQNFGFEMVSIAIYKTGNGPNSQDVIDAQEKIVKQKAALESAKLEKEILVERGMAAVIVEEKQLSIETKAFGDRSKTLITLMQTKDETAIGVAENLGKLPNGSIFFGGRSPLETESADMQNIMMGSIAASTFTKKPSKKDDRKGGRDEK